MRIEVIPQLDLRGIQYARVGDIINRFIADDAFLRFRFAVAFMRMSGLDRLAGSIDSLINRGGSVSGAVGIDQGITSIEALDALSMISSNSTIFYTVSGFIYHPKLYLMNGENQAVAVVGSANLTRDGLFRNIELATAVHLNLDSSIDLEIYNLYDAFINNLLDTTHPNIKSITNTTLQTLANAGLIKHEAQVSEPGPTIRPGRTTRTANVPTNVESLFPPLYVPVAPPSSRVIPRQPTIQPLRISTPTPQITSNTFIMQLSAFDSSHRTGVPGTPEILIPHAAIGFFPTLSLTTRRYPDVEFDVVLNTPTGRERHSYRLWYYEQRAVGTRIDEYRLRMNHDTVDLSTLGGGDLLIINKLLNGSDPAYEVTILPQTDPTYSSFLLLCNREIRGKKWGII